MKRYFSLFIFLSFFVTSYSQNYPIDGKISKKTFLAGFETAGSYTKLRNYDNNDKDYIAWSLRTVPKFAYSPINNLLLGLSLSYEIGKSNIGEKAEIYGIGSFIRLYLPFINQISRANNVIFFKERLFFFSEIAYERNNNFYDLSGLTVPQIKLLNNEFNFLIGINFRIYKKLYIETSYGLPFHINYEYRKRFPLYNRLGFEFIF